MYFGKVPVGDFEDVCLSDGALVLQVALVAAQDHVGRVVEGVSAQLRNPVGHIKEATYIIGLDWTVSKNVRSALNEQLSTIDSFIIFFGSSLSEGSWS